MKLHVVELEIEKRALAGLKDWLDRAGVDTRVITPGDMGHELALDRKPDLYRQALSWLDRGDRNKNKGGKSRGDRSERVARK